MLWQNFRGFSSKSRENFSWGLTYFDKFIYFISLLFFSCRYCGSSNQWTVITKIRTPRSECACAIVREKIYVIGGYNWNASQRLSDVECYDTDTGTWSSHQELEQPLTGAGAVGLTVYNPRKTSDKTVVLKDVGLPDKAS